ncbi:hypothetical protein Tco_0331350 [Tanacetum coccineum]
MQNYRNTGKQYLIQTLVQRGHIDVDVDDNVVNVENKNSWCWFLSFLDDDLHLEDGLGLTIILDAHKGLIEVVKTWLPHTE